MVVFGFTVAYAMGVKNIPVRCLNNLKMLWTIVFYIA